MAIRAADPGPVTGSNQILGGHTYSFGYNYNLADALTSTTYPSGRVVATNYDGANRVASVTSGSTTYFSGRQLNNGTLQSRTTTHNGTGFSSAVTFSASYGYDGLNRLTSAGESGNWSQSYGYDRYGNMWLSGTSGSTGLRWTGQPLSRRGGAAVPEFDAVVEQRV